MFHYFCTVISLGICASFSNEPLLIFLVLRLGKFLCILTKNHTFLERKERKKGTTYNGITDKLMQYTFPLETSEYKASDVNSFIFSMF